jgi:hypothetical protein
MYPETPGNVLMATVSQYRSGDNSTFRRRQLAEQFGDDGGGVDLILSGGARRVGEQADNALAGSSSRPATMDVDTDVARGRDQPALRLAHSTHSVRDGTREDFLSSVLSVGRVAKASQANSIYSDAVRGK